MLPSAVFCTTAPLGWGQFPFNTNGNSPVSSLANVVGLLQKRGSGCAVITAGTRTLTAEVLGSTPWFEPSWSPPLSPPPLGFFFFFFFVLHLDYMLDLDYIKK